MDQTAEGVHTAQIVVELADLNGVEMPLSAAVDAVLKGNCTAEEAMMALMGRQARPEPELFKQHRSRLRRAWRFVKRSK